MSSAVTSHYEMSQNVITDRTSQKADGVDGSTERFRDRLRVVVASHTDALQLLLHFSHRSFDTLHGRLAQNGHMIWSLDRRTCEYGKYLSLDKAGIRPIEHVYSPKAEN